LMQSIKVTLFAYNKKVALNDKGLILLNINYHH